VSGRAAQVLSRFPAHLEAAKPGKRLGAAAAALALPLDLLSADMAGVRTAHRPGQARELIDLLRVAALHGLDGPELALLFRRVREAGDLPAGLGADEPGHRTLLEALRQRLRQTIAIHRRGNGTVRALLEGAAAALGLELGEIVHSEDHFWHAAPARDALHAIAGPDPTGRGEDVVGMEENPLHREADGPAPRRHADLFDVTRRGFGPVRLRVRITGLEDRTVAPRLVDRDEGRGIGFAETVPAGQVLEITEEGRALLDGADVTAFAWCWEGACFAAPRTGASPDPRQERDFVFAGPDLDPRLASRVARFAIARPEGAFDPDFVFPGAGERVPPLGLGLGTTRFAFFVQEAHFAAAATRAAVGFFDGSVFATAPGQEAPAPSAGVELSWLEHEAYAVRVLVPGRFAPLAGDPAQTTAAITAALERFRPAGVDLRVEFLDPHLVLDESVLPGERPLGPLDLLRPGTLLAAPPGS
jgi:hypothetical protein